VVTEVVEIVVRERGAQQTASAISGIGGAAKAATIALGAMLAALGAISAVRGLAGLAADAVKVSAEFEGFGVRLRTLLGSQTEANTALSNFTTLASKTPFAVGQIVEGATTLASVALGNRKRLEELTQVAANLAAVTGLSFQETAGNLQRALSNGIAAADLFRDRGVRQLIESIAGIPDATKLSTQELERVFQQVFGPGGVFGGAAEALSNTLTGALSNIGDAAANAKRALGDAFAPAVIAAARQVIIPFLERLQKLIDENRGAITEFAARGLQQAIRGLITLAEVGLTAVQAMDRFFGFVRASLGTLLELAVQLQRAEVAVNRFGNTLGLATDQDLADSQAALRATELALGGMAEGQAAATRRTELLDQAVGALRTQLGTLRDTLGRADFTNLPAAGPDIPLPVGGGGAAVDPKVAAAEAKAIAAAEQERATALQRVLDLTERIRVSNLQQTEPLDATLERLRQQKDELISAGFAASDLKATKEGTLLLDEQIAEVERQKVALSDEQTVLQARIADLVAEIAQTSPEFAASLEAAALAAIAAGGGLEKVNGELRQLTERGSAELQREKQRIEGLGEQIGDTLKGGITDALGALRNDEGIQGFADALASTSSSLLEQSLNQALESVGKSLQPLFEKIGGGSAASAGALAGALGLGLGVLSSVLSSSAAEISSGFVESAVTDSRELRGVVAGPTSIPIFQLGEELENVMEPLVSVARLQLVVLERIDRSLAAGDGGAVGSATASELATTSTTLG
jgi:hypothetical protein